MVGNREYETARDRAVEVLADLRRHRLTPSPENYRVWYVYLSGEDPALSRTLKVLLDSGDPIDEACCAELHDRFFVQAAEERNRLRAGQRLNELAGELTRELSAFGTETARFGSTLSEAKERFGASPDPERIRSILRGIVEETSRMQGHTDRVEAHLRASVGEIDELRRNLQAARNEARTDGLTGLANRKHFDQALRIAAAQAIDQGSPACLALADIDHFKRFNDLYGHALGDQVLKLVAGVLRQNVKGRDLVARYGGEEFAAILPATRLSDARTLVDQLRELVASREIQLKGRSQTLGRVTLSIGVTDFRPGEPCAAWLARAAAATAATATGAVSGGSGEGRARGEPTRGLA